jgi:hypothetical protein
MFSLYRNIKLKTYGYDHTPCRKSDFAVCSHSTVRECEKHMGMIIFYAEHLTLQYVRILQDAENGCIHIWSYSKQHLWCECTNIFTLQKLNLTWTLTWIFCVLVSYKDKRDIRYFYSNVVPIIITTKLYYVHHIKHYSAHVSLYKLHNLRHLFSFVPTTKSYLCFQNNSFIALENL